MQIKLVPVNAPYFDGARLLIAADCTAYAYAAFHERFIRGHITLVGCPKLDDVDYSEKLTAIIRSNDIQEVTVVRMEVPCCGGLENAAKRALQASGKFIPWQVVTISTDGRILDRFFCKKGLHSAKQYAIITYVAETQRRICAVSSAGRASA